jgi:hypothetical protein
MIMSLFLYGTQLGEKVNFLPAFALHYHALRASGLSRGSGLNQESITFKGNLAYCLKTQESIFLFLIGFLARNAAG